MHNNKKMILLESHIKSSEFLNSHYASYYFFFDVLKCRFFAFDGVSLLYSSSWMVNSRIHKSISYFLQILAHKYKFQIWK